ncbi:MAG: hypothetical protein IIA05_02485 [Proteobacteria bacterium]|nr:hypothetical protein [Pseudomonadota bacterium]MCH9025967.1 hypothetical protein [Pseudomonadota bacterium]
MREWRQTSFSRAGLCGPVVIEGFRRLSAADGHSQAVVLSTEDPNNLRFFKKMGSHIVAGAKVGELHTWCLALPLPGPE